MLGILLRILIFIPIGLLVIKLITKTSVLHLLMKQFRSFTDSFYAYQTYQVPNFNQNSQENHLYRKIQTYIQSLPAVEDADDVNLLTGVKSNDVVLRLDSGHSIIDSFLGARLVWTNRTNSSFQLKIRRSDSRRVFRPYLQHVQSIADEVDQRKKDLKLYMNCFNGGDGGGGERWRSVAFTHPATLDSLSMDGDIKNRVKADWEQFLRSKQYYQKLGRVWKRSYLLYGPSGTGKSSFVAAMAKFLGFNVYDVDLMKVSDDSDLKLLLAQTKPKSIILVEDLDKFLKMKALDLGTGANRSGLTLSGLLNFMDGVAASCAEERVMVFTVNSKDAIDPAVLRPGRIDVHIHFPLCDFLSFKTLASSHLGVKEHKLFQQVEEMIQSGARLSPAEIGELMISNRSSPTRALKSVITALQRDGGEAKMTGVAAGGHRRQASGSVRGVEEEMREPESVICTESVHTVREFRKLYGLLRLRSRKEEPSEAASVDKSL